MIFQNYYNVFSKASLLFQYYISKIGHNFESIKIVRKLF